MAGAAGVSAAGVSADHTWLRDSHHGICNATNPYLFFQPQASCLFGERGAWGLNQREAQRWETAVAACQCRCRACRRCQYISVSPSERRCAWYHQCHLDRLLERRRYAARSALVPKVVVEQGADDAAMHATRDVASEPRAREQLRLLPPLECSERYISLVGCGGRWWLFSRRNLGRDIGRLPGTAPPSTPNHSYTYHPHAIGTAMPWYEALVRATAPANDLSDGGGASWRTLRFGREANRTLRWRGDLRHAALSHNAGFTCAADGRTLLVYGGLEWQHGEHPPYLREAFRGIERRTADATAPPPLEWTSPVGARRGWPRETGCIDDRSRFPTVCEYDGKIALLRTSLHLLGGGSSASGPLRRGGSHTRLLLYARSNLSPSGGGRHVQVATSTDEDGRGWSAFVQLRIDGYRATAENSIYFFTARRLRTRSLGVLERALARPEARDRDLGLGLGLGLGRNLDHRPREPPASGRELASGRVLLAAYPAVIGGDAGVFVGLSVDGVRWTRPIRIARGSALPGGRTDVFPSDVQPQWHPRADDDDDDEPGPPRADEHSESVDVLIQTQIDLRIYTNATQNENCRLRPRFEAVAVQLAPLFRDLHGMLRRQHGDGLLRGHGNAPPQPGAMAHEPPVSCSPFERFETVR